MQPLTESDKQLLALRHGAERLSFAQIGDRMGKTKNAVEKHYRRLERRYPGLDLGELGGYPDAEPGADPIMAGDDRVRASGDRLGEAGLPGASGPDQRGDPAIADLRAALREANRKLGQAKARKDELVAAVHEAVDVAARGIDVPAVPAPVADVRGFGEEVAVVMLSDWQLGKRTPSYDSDVCAERVEKLAEKVVNLTRIQRADHPVRELRVHLLGDIVEGEQIFPGQSHLIDASLFEQTVETGPTILVNFLRRMLLEFERIHVVAVIGNHGRIGRKGDFDPQTNADRMLYRVAQRILEAEPRITWDIPSVKHERAWYAVSRIGNYAALLLHGDQFRGTAGIPWYGIQKKAGGWALGAIDEAFDEIHFGHFHTPMTTVLNKVIARCNGSTESHNTFAQEQLAAVGEPSQQLLFVHPEKGFVTASYTVWL